MTNVASFEQPSRIAKCWFVKIRICLNHQMILISLPYPYSENDAQQFILFVSNQNEQDELLYRRKSGRGW